MHPPCLRGQGDDCPKPSKQNARGMLQMATGTPPNADLHPMRALFLIPKSPAPALLGPFSQALKDFVARCLQKVRLVMLLLERQDSQRPCPAASWPYTGSGMRRTRRCGHRRRSCWGTPSCATPRSQSTSRSASPSSCRSGAR